MSSFCIYLDVEPYLKQWFINDMGDEHPVTLVRNCAESDIIKNWLIKLPEDEKPQLSNQNMLAIYIPSYKDIDTETYYHLSPAALRLLKQCIRNRFVVELWKDLHNFGYIGIQKQDVIYAWMEAHHIEPTETNFNSIAKIYQRKRDVYKKLKSRKKVPKFKKKK